MAQKKAAAPKSKKLTPEEVYQKIQTAAYLAAEKDGFRQDPSAYWLQAENEVSGR